MISLLTPTRGRPDGVTRMWESAISTAKDPTRVELLLRCDDDDPTRLDVYPRLVEISVAVTLITRPRDTLSKYWTELVEYAKGPYLMGCADDIIFRSEHWDEMVLATFAKYPDNIVFVFGRDGFQDHRLGTHGFVHRDWVEAVGYFTAPYFSSDYGDTWLNELASGINRRVFVPEIFTEHMHPDAGKGEWDQTHLEREARGREDNVDALYRELKHKREEDIEKLRRAIECSS